MTIDSITQIKLRPHQEAAIDAIRREYSLGARAPLLTAPTGCHAKGTSILMFDGKTKLVEDVVVGDLLMGPDNKYRRVLRLCRGTDQMFRITPKRKGESFVVNGGHVLHLCRTNEGKTCGRQYQAINQTVADYLASSKTWKHIHKLVRSGCDFQSKELFFDIVPMASGCNLDPAKRVLSSGGTLSDAARAVGTSYQSLGSRLKKERGALRQSFRGFPVTPYFMGLYLGDGSARSGAITTADDEIINAVHEEAAKFGCNVRHEPMTGNAASNYYIVSDSRGPYQNRYRSALRSVGVFGVTCSQKRIPSAYKIASREDRLSLLAGLIDADGHLSSGGYDFCLASEGLRDDIVFVARSLGFAASKGLKVVGGKPYYRAIIDGHDGLIPCRVARKAGAKRKQKKNHLVSGFDVEPLGLGDFFGFELDGDHLYLTSDFVIHHNSGKTVLFTYIAKQASLKGKKILILVHRKELVDQTCRTLEAFGVEHGLITAGMPFIASNVQVASVQTLVRRMDKLGWIPDLIIVDEAHHAAGKTTWGKVLAHYDTLVLGVTATPERLDGLGLGVECDGYFDRLIMGPSVRELVEQGYLSPPVVYAPPPPDLSSIATRGGDYAKGSAADALDRPTITGDAVEHYRKLCDGKPAIAFCTTVAHAEHVAEHFAREGFNAASIDGKLASLDRAQRIKDLGEGKLNVLTSCDIISEGTDIPIVSAAILLRPTQSLGLYLQQVGRVLRPAPGKERAIILDHVGNVFRHGLPDDERTWSLDSAKRSKRKKTDAFPVRQCERCFFVHPPAPVCPNCGNVYQLPKRSTPEQVDGELREVDPDALRRKAKKEQGAAQSLAELYELAKQRGYKPGWAVAVWRARQKKSRVVANNQVAHWGIIEPVGTDESSEFPIAGDRLKFRKSLGFLGAQTEAVLGETPIAPIAPHSNNQVAH